MFDTADYNEHRFMTATEDSPLTPAERAEMDAKYAAAAARRAAKAAKN